MPKKLSVGVSGCGFKVRDPVPEGNPMTLQLREWTNIGKHGIRPAPPFRALRAHAGQASRLTARSHQPRHRNRETLRTFFICKARP